MKSALLRRFAAFLFLSASLAVPSLRAQDPPPPPPDSPPAPVAPVAPVAAPAPAGDPLRVERRVYVPFEDLEKTMKDQGQGVFLPYREFLDMWNQLLAQKEQEKVNPPADGLLSSAAFTGRVEGDVAIIDAVLQVESFKDGWAVLPLGGQGLSVAKAETGTATLRRTDAGMEVLLPAKGKYELKLQIFAALQRGTGRQSVTLTLPKTAVSKLDLTIPESGWEFSTAPATAFTAVPAADGQSTQVSVFFGERDGMTLSWQKAGGESKLTPLLFADTQAACALAAGALHTEVSVNYSILRAGVSEFTLAVPQPHEVLAVRGENIKEWNVVPAAEAGGPQVLTVTLHAAARERFALALDLEAPVEKLPVSLQAPQVEARGVLRQSGNVEIRSASELDTEVAGVTGLAQQAVTAAPDSAQAAPGRTLLGNWRYLKLPWTLTLTAKKAEPVVEVDSFTDFRVQPDVMTFRADFTWTVKRAGIFDAALRIPAGWDNVEASGEAVEGFSEETTGEGAAAVRTLTVRFRNRLEGSTTLRVTGRQLRAGAETEAAVPVFLPLGVARHDALAGVHVDETLDANTREPGGLKQEDVRRLAEKAPASVNQSAGLWTIGFRYRGEAAPAILTFRTKKPQVSGEVLTLTEIKDQSVSHRWWLQWDVLYSGVDTYYLSVPLDIAGDIRVETRTLKEVDKTWLPATGADAARQYWKIVARDKVPGKFLVELSYEAPLGTLEAGKNVSVPVPEVALLDLFQETGQIAVVKSGSLEVLTPDKSAALEPVDPKELDSVLQKPGVFLAWKWKRHPATVTLPVSRNELVSVPQAIVTYADLTTVMSTDEAMTTEVVYHVRNNTQQYFTVKLPPGGRMLSDVTVAGVPQQPQHRADKDEMLIRLPAAQEQKGEFVIRFVYDVASPHAGQGLAESGAVKLAPAELVDASVLQSQLQLYLPAGYVWQEFDSSMNRNPGERGWGRYRTRLGWLVPALGPQPLSPRENAWSPPPSLTASDRGPFDFQLPRDGQPFLLHRLDKPTAVAVTYRTKRMEYTFEALGALLGLGIGFLLRRRSPGVKMGYVLFGGIGALVLEGALGAGTSGFLHYFFAGVMIAVIYWFVCGFFRLFRRRKTVAAVPAGPAKAPAVPSVKPPVPPAAPVPVVTPVPEAPAPETSGPEFPDISAPDADKPQTPPQS